MIYFLIPVFNEEANLESLYKTLTQSLPGREKFFLFVDDCSVDNSVSMLKDLFRAIPQFEVLTKTVNAGPGHSFNMGFEWILSHSENSAHDLVITMEADNTSDIKILSDMIAISGMGYDLVLASVYAQGGGFGSTSLFRKLISFFANILLRFAFGIKVLTLSSFYRVYHLTLLSEIKKKHSTIIEEPGFISMVEILIKAIRLDAKIIEVPVRLFAERRKGKSKMKIANTFLSYVKLLMKAKK